MNLIELDSYFNSFLKKEIFLQDPSKNGIQIQNSAPNTKQIKKVAFAVDASLDTAKKASQIGADVLFVHHGLFWGSCDVITGTHYARLCEFIKNDLALCAYHIPLDANNEVGNNYGMAKKIGLVDLEPFALWRGMTIGVKGRLEIPKTVKDVESAALNGEKANFILPFGKELNTTVGIVSGGAGDDYKECVKEGLDLFITGEICHEEFNPIKEARLNVIAGGHYATETIGVNLVKEKMQNELGIEGVFLDFPSGM